MGAKADRDAGGGPPDPTGGAGGRGVGMSTPCVGVCQARDGACVGCLRTLAEIAAWSGLSEAERLRIMHHELPQRRQRAQPGDPTPKAGEAPG